MTNGSGTNGLGFGPGDLERELQRLLGPNASLKDLFEPFTALWQGAAGARRGVREVTDLYLEDLKGRSCPEGYTNVCHLLNLFAAEHAGKAAADCGPLDLERWLRSHPEWKADWTLRRVNATVQACWNWLVRARLVPDNPFKGVKCRTGKRRRAVTGEEFAALLAGAPPHLKRLLLFLRETGCRPGEARALRWEHLDWGKGVAVLPPALHKTGWKTGKPRKITLTAPVLELLTRLRAGAAGGPVFLNSHGKPWSKSVLTTRLYRLRQRLGLPAEVKLYGLRHAFAVGATLAGVGLKTLAELLGHTTTAMAEYYVDLSGQDDHLADAAERAARAARPRKEAS